MKRTLALILALLLIVGVFAGCQSNKQDDQPGASEEVGGGSENSVGSNAEEVEHVDSSARGVVPGTVLNLGQTSDKPNHLPWLNTAGNFLYQQVYDTLFYPVDGDWANIDGLLAESWTWDDDGLGITVKLNEGVKFTSGNTLDAKAVVDCFKYTEEYMGTFFAKIESYEATGDYELYFKFSGAYPDFCTQFSTANTGIADPAAVAEYGPEDNKAAIGSGPYMIDSYAPTELLVLKANADYWREDRMPSVETVNFVYIPDANTEQIALQNGEIDFMEVGDLNTLAIVETYENVTYQEYAAVHLPFWFNQNNPALADIRVREAISKMIDIDEVAYMVSGDFGVVRDTPWLAENLANSGSRDITPDGDAALALMDEAGVDPKGMTLKAIGCPHTKVALTTIQAQLANYGITFDFEIIDYASFASEVAGGDWDICTITGVINTYAPMDGMNSFFGKEGMLKLADFTNSDPAVAAEINGLLDTARAATSMDEQLVPLRQITEILNDNYAWVCAMTMCKFNVYSTRLSNVHFEGANGFLMCYDVIIAE